MASQAELQAIIDRRNKILVEKIKDVPQDVRDIEAENRTELDVYYFQAFVPFFLGDEDILYWPNTKQGRAKAREQWVGLAGGFYTEVDVTRIVNGVKEIVFTVPAILNREMVEPVITERGQPSVYTAVLTANNLMAHSPMHAEAYLKDKLGERLERMWHPETMAKNAEMWNKIAAFFGRKPHVPALAPAQAATEDSSKDEILGFDPF